MKMYSTILIVSLLALIISGCSRQSEEEILDDVEYDLESFLRTFQDQLIRDGIISNKSTNGRKAVVVMGYRRRNI